MPSLARLRANRTVTLVEVGDDAPVVSLEAAKQHLRIIDDDADDLIFSEIDAAISWAEDQTARPIRRAEYLMTLESFQYIDGWPSIRIQGYVHAVDSIQYRNSAGTLQTIATSVYEVLKGQHSTMIREATNQAWPALHHYMDAVRVTFTAGWIDTDVPHPIRQAILLKISAIHDAEDGPEKAALSLLAPWKLPVW